MVHKPSCVAALPRTRPSPWAWAGNPLSPTLTGFMTRSSMVGRDSRSVKTTEPTPSRTLAHSPLFAPFSPRRNEWDDALAASEQHHRERPQRRTRAHWSVDAPSLSSFTISLTGSFYLHGGSDPRRQWSLCDGQKGLPLIPSDNDPWLAVASRSSGEDLPRRRPFELRRPWWGWAQRRWHDSFPHDSDFSQSATATPALRTMTDRRWRAPWDPSWRAYSCKVEVAAPPQSLCADACNRSMATVSLLS
jgi:hypothetical protein